MKKIHSDAIRKAAAVGVALLCFGFAVVRLSDWRSSRAERRHWELKQKGDLTNTPLPKFKSLMPGEMESAVSALAKQAGVHRLASVGAMESGSEKQLQIEWEGNQATMFKFLRLLEQSGTVGPASRLAVAGSEKDNGGLRATAVFPIGSGHSDKASVIVDSIPKRDIFLALWRPNEASSDTAAAAAMEAKRLAETQQKDQERQDAERRTREEADRLAAKENELRSGFVLTGIVNNGHETMAFVNQKSNGSALMVKNGDMVGDARVTRIDEERNEIHLDYNGRFEVVLRINSSGGGNFQ